MSNFNCEHCGAPCFDSPAGYTTGCEHYPPDIKQVPKIKPLVWQQPCETFAFAQSPIAEFRCQFFQHANQWSVSSSQWSESSMLWLDSLEEAKAACEAEYERRVRECLE